MSFYFVRLSLIGSACLVAVPAFTLAAATFTPGSGSPTGAIQASFINAYNRGRFSQLTLAPSGDVKALGSPGLVQEFPAKTDSSVYALVKPDPTVPTGNLDTLQVYGDIYKFYTSVGVATAGYPVIDTTPCFSAALGPCDYETFTKNYALFAYPAGTMNFAVRDPFFTEWTNGGGITTYGSATSAETAVISVSGVMATQQLFASGAVFSYPAGSATPTTIGLVEPFNTAFNNAAGYMRIGLPTSEPTVVNSAGLMRQTFEFGRIELAPGGSPVTYFSISLIGIAGQAQGLTLSVGASATLTAVVIDITNQPVTGRALTWSTSNGSVARVIGNGDTATVQAVGPGAASIYLSGEGKTSLPLVVRVGSVCCAVGEGAPTQAIAQAFQAAVDRNHLALISPAAAPVTRVGNGYIQAFAAADGSGTSYIVAQADNSGIAYVIFGALNTAYTAAGGFTGTLGYPASDPLSGGAQQFTSGAALGGMPVRVVPAPVATKWFQLGGPTGSAGSPTADAAAFVSLNGSLGVSQAFGNGSIFTVTAGFRAGLSAFSGGLVLARYLIIGGPAGVLGLPLGDVTTNGAVQSENFEGGYIDLQPGATAAVEHLNPRHPAITLSQSSVVPGGRLHISATGFAPGAIISFTITGQPGFSVTASTGVFSWDVVIPASAKPGAVSIQAATPNSADSASAVYTVTSVSASLPKFTIVSGDQQTGLPGSTLALPVAALLQDGSGNPLPGVPVSFSGSAGATVQSPLVTDQNGRVAIHLRLPSASGIMVGSLAAGAQVVTFSAIAAPGTLQNFPSFPQGSQQNPEVAALASLLRYDENLGSLPAPNGPANPDALAQFAASKGAVFQTRAGESIANPWIAAQFASAGLSLEAPTADHVRDLLNIGVPASLVLALTVDGGLYGSDTVDAIGVAGDGSILVVDSDALTARTSLTDFLNGFSADGHQVQGTITAVLRVSPASVPAGAPFTVSSVVASGVSVASAAGLCASVDILGSSGADGERFQYCDGSQGAYQVNFGSAGSATITDFSPGPPERLSSASGPGSFSISRNNGQLAAGLQSLSIAAVTDSAAFAPGLSPGGLATIFGTGFVSGPAAAVTLNGAQIPVLGIFPFQINVQIPAGVAPGSASLQVTGALGVATQALAIVPYAPGIFLAGDQAAIVNQDGTLNGAAAPVQRGQYISIYCTGLGATVPKGGLQATSAPVTVVVNGATLTPLFSGLAPGFTGLYQINVTIPGGLPPNATGSLAVKEGNQTSNSVPFSVQ